MKYIRNSTEDEMILEFLKGEINSSRFNDKLVKVLKTLNFDKEIIISGDIYNQLENKKRLRILKMYRGYPNEKLFKNFPTIKEWKYIQLSSEDLKSIFYINYDYWNELSNNTSSPIEASKNIKSGVEVFGISNKQYTDGVKFLENNKFSPIVLITCDDQKYLILEGHVRMTVYSLVPDKMEGTYAFVGYCTPEDMKKYDSKMVK